MKTRYLIVLLVAFVLGFGLTAFSYADEGHRGSGYEGVRDINNRIRIAHEKIDKGIDSGALTREEAHRLKGELDAVRDDEARMRADGRLNPHERDRLERELDRLEKHIFNLKHNDNRRDDDHRGGYEGIQNIDQRIDAAHHRIHKGVESGALTKHEADKLKGQLDALRDDEARMRADGRLNPHERERLERELDRLEKHIHHLIHNDNRR